MTPGSTSTSTPATSAASASIASASASAAALAASAAELLVWLCHLQVMTMCCCCCKMEGERAAAKNFASLASAVTCNARAPSGKRKAPMDTCEWTAGQVCDAEAEDL
jgi:hypothetical protein